jgi:PAS domain S-box-containing protein
VTAFGIEPQELVMAVIEMSDDAIFTCDTAARVTSWGATAERLFGCPGSDVIGRPLDTLFPEHLRHEVQAVMATVLAGDRIEHFETEVLRPDGMPMPVSLSACQLGGSARQVAGSLVIARDVTEQRLAQATLAEVESRLEEGEALAHVGSWLWDLRTGAVQWSAEFHRIHGVDPLDFDGTFESHLALVHPDDRDTVRAAIEQVVTSGRPFDGEYRVLRPDDQVRVVRVRAQPAIGSGGEVVGLRGIGQDVTEGVVAGVSPGRRET